MNTDTIKGKWQQIKGDLQKTWGKITDDEWESTRGETNAVSGLVQNKYGHTKDEVSQKLTDIYDRYTSDTKSNEADTDFVNQLRRDTHTNEKRTTEF